MLCQMPSRALDRATDVLLARIQHSPNDALAGATAYLELLGLTVGSKP